MLYRGKLGTKTLAGEFGTDVIVTVLFRKAVITSASVSGGSRQGADRQPSEGNAAQLSSELSGSTALL